MALWDSLWWLDLHVGSRLWCQWPCQYTGIIGCYNASVLQSVNPFFWPEAEGRREVYPPVLLYFLFSACVRTLGQHWSAQGHLARYLLCASASSMFFFPFLHAPGIPRTFLSPLLYLPCRENRANVLSWGGLTRERGNTCITGRLGFVMVDWPSPSWWASSWAYSWKMDHMGV